MVRRGSARSARASTLRKAPVAQGTERRTSNPRVAGSNPAGRIEDSWRVVQPIRATRHTAAVPHKCPKRLEREVAARHIPIVTAA